jgi:hypothetical protein
MMSARSWQAITSSVKDVITAHINPVAGATSSKETSYGDEKHMIRHLLKRTSRCSVRLKY